MCRLALALCRTPRLRESWLAEHAQGFAVAVALLFASHPIQVQAVTYIVQRMSSMAALFYLSAVLCYVRCRTSETTSAPGNPRRAYLAAVGFAAAAAFSKENTASLPLAIVLTEWAFFGGGSRLLFSRRLLPFVLLGLAMPIIFWALDRRPAPAPSRAEEVRVTAPHRADESATPLRAKPVPVLARGEEFAARLQRAASAGDISPLTYVLTQCRVLPRYLGLRNGFRLAVFRQTITEDERAQCWEHFEQDLAAGVYERAAVPRPALYERATRPVDAHSARLGTRTLDVLHVAAASVLEVKTFLSFDRRQRSLARAAGLRVAPHDVSHFL